MPVYFVQWIKAGFNAQFNPKDNYAGVWHHTRSNANRFPADWSKTRLNAPFHIEVNLSIDLNPNFLLD